MATARNIEQIFAILDKTYPNPKSPLNYDSPFQLLVAVILSAQATDVGVNKVTKDLFKIAPTPERMLQVGEKELKKFIKSIGFYNTKAKNIIKTTKVLVEKFASQVPATREALESLPGVGRKTANIILNVIFANPTIAVDRHVFRICNRTKIAAGKTPRLVEDALIKDVPQKFISKAHHLLLLHAKAICIARKPKCQQCCINSFCAYYQNNKTISTSIPTPTSL